MLSLTQQNIMESKEKSVCVLKVLSFEQMELFKINDPLASTLQAVCVLSMPEDGPVVCCTDCISEEKRTRCVQSELYKQ